MNILHIQPVDTEIPGGISDPTAGLFQAILQGPGGHVACGKRSLCTLWPHRLPFRPQLRAS